MILSLLKASIPVLTVRFAALGLLYLALGLLYLLGKLIKK